MVTPPPMQPPIALGAELFWLTCITLFTALLWVPYVLNRIREHGLVPALRNPDRDLRPKARWADRLMAAHANAVENLVIFAPLALAVAATGTGTATTSGACAGYFFSRVAHTFIYTAGLPYARTVAFLLGVAAQLVLALHLLSRLPPT